jgi:threonine aldolase
MFTVDLRSDTVTRPSDAMKKAMIESPVGDDVLGDDPTVQRLESMMAERFGMDGALFCVSGTQANQIALMSHLSPGDQVICHPYAHIYNYEGGGIAANAHASVAFTGDDRGIMHPQGVLSCIKADDIHFPRTRVLAVENTSNKGGGTCYEWEEIEALRAVASKHGLLFHLDGARLYNALVAKGHSESDYGAAFDSISICLSKGLGAPVGSILLGNDAFIAHAKRIRKRIGGGWRQAGFLAGAALYAMEHNVERLAEDHAAARDMAEFLQTLPYVDTVIAPETNVLIFGLKEEMSQDDFIAGLAAKEIGISQMGPGKCRMVFHLDITADHIATVKSVLNSI